MKKILIVEDEPKIVELVRRYLERDGYQVSVAEDGRKALETVRSWQPDLILLDLNLPDMDGLEVCRTVRHISAVPIIMLTARDEDVDKLIGLELGADDYITKPFSPREVVARVHAVLRRAQLQAVTSDIIKVGGLFIDISRHEARCHDKLLDLTATEFKLLLMMARSPGRVFTRMQLLDEIQGIAYEGYERTIDAHIKNLRHKMESGQGCRIATVRGVGYKLEDARDA